MRSADATFDYLIVGAGTAGCVLANRLSADPTVSIGLIEAGPSHKRLAVRIPAIRPSVGATSRFRSIISTTVGFRFRAAA